MQKPSGDVNNEENLPTPHTTVSKNKKPDINKSSTKELQELTNLIRKSKNSPLIQNTRKS